MPENLVGRIWEVEQRISYIASEPMAMDQFPKRVKRIIRELAGRAYEIELGRALAELQAQFGKWERGEINPFDLSAAIHEYHHGTDRFLYNKYNSPDQHFNVANAIGTGILDRSEIDPEVLEHLADTIRYYESA
jgi:hypothetical protein